MAFYSEVFMSFFCLLLGVIAVMGSLDLPMFAGHVPAAGLWPVVLGSVLVLLCLYNLAKLKVANDSADKTINKDEVTRLFLFTALFYGMTLIFTQFIGLLPTLSIFLAYSLYKWYEMKPLKAVITGVGAGLTIYFVFTVLLGLPFPWGMLADLM